MEQGQIIQLIHAGLTEILWLALPILGIGLVAGLIISIVQATTQINEQTIVFVVKILSVFVALMVFGAWMLQRLQEFMYMIYEQVLLILRS
ncbi:hypothetical protein FACS1894208_10990 [Clostridia bacterium]|nr:hypothetical protein FACS1894208_10990 [Clostridia bacterium]